MMIRGYTAWKQHHTYFPDDITQCQRCEVRLVINTYVLYQFCLTQIMRISENH